MVFLFMVSDRQRFGDRSEWLKCQVPGTRRPGIISLTPAQTLGTEVKWQSGFLIPHFSSALGPVFFYFSRNNGHVFHNHSLLNMNLFKIIQIKLYEFMYSSSNIIASIIRMLDRNMTSSFIFEKVTCFEIMIYVCG